MSQTGNTRGTSRSKAERNSEREWKKAKERLTKKAAKERLSWLPRPRLHTGIFEDAWRDEQTRKKCAEQGVRISEEVERHWAEQKAKVQVIAKKFGWSEERLTSFRGLVVAYRQLSSASNYMQVRRGFPELEIQIAQFGGIDPLYALEGEFKKKGIDPELVAGALDGDEPSIDVLSLRLLELLVERDNLPKTGPGHLNQRHDAISDAIVDYLIVTMLEAFDWHSETFRVPGSLVVLIRHQLCGTTPDLHVTYLLKEKRQNAAIVAAQLLKPNEKLSIGKLATIANIPRSTAARWIANPEFKRSLDSAKKWVADGKLKSAGT